MLPMPCMRRQAEVFSCYRIKGSYKTVNYSSNDSVTGFTEPEERESTQDYRPAVKNDRVSQQSIDYIASADAKCVMSRSSKSPYVINVEEVI